MIAMMIGEVMKNVRYMRKIHENDRIVNQRGIRKAKHAITQQACQEWKWV